MATRLEQEAAAIRLRAAVKELQFALTAANNLGMLVSIACAHGYDSCSTLSSNSRLDYVNMTIHIKV